MLHNITKREKIIVMLAVMSGLFLVALDQTIISTALSAIVKEFNSYSALGFVVTAYMLTSTVTVPLAGKLSDMYGRRPILLSGVLIFTIASLLSGMSQNIEQLIAFRAVQGLGGGIIMANAFTIIGDLFTPRERGRWQGFIGAVFGLSSVIGPLLGGWLTDGQNLIGMTTDWRWTFFINVPIGIVSALVIARYCPSIKHDSKHQPDYLGALFITAALSSLVLAVDNTDVIFSNLIAAGVNLATIKTVLFTITAVSTAAFVVVESKAKQPIIPLRFFANRTFSLIVSAMLLFGAAFLGAILYLTQFNQQVFGASASEAGMMLLPMIAGLMLSSLSVGQITSRTGRYKAFMVAGFTIATMAMFSLTTLHSDSLYWEEAVRMAFAGFGLGMVMPLLNVAVQNEFEQKDLGAATASVQLFRGLGSTIGTAVMSGILTTGIATSIGDPNNIPYIQTLKNTPAASQMIDGEISADTLLRINMQQSTISEGANKALDNAPVPAEVREKQKQSFNDMQKDFSEQVIEAFSDALRNVFMISGVLMLAALVLIVFVRERKLRDAPNTTPGV